MLGLQDSDDDGPDMMSDTVLELLASPLLGPCKVKQLDLTNQRGVGMSVAALAGGRFPGGNLQSLCPPAPVSPVLTVQVLCNGGAGLCVLCARCCLMHSIY